VVCLRRLVPGFTNCVVPPEDLYLETGPTVLLKGIEEFLTSGLPTTLDETRFSVSRV